MNESVCLLRTDAGVALHRPALPDTAPRSAQSNHVKHVTQTRFLFKELISYFAILQLAFYIYGKVRNLLK